MQEEIENRSVTLAISTTRLTGRVLKAAINKYLAYRKEKQQQKNRDSPVTPHGKQTVKQLVGQGQGVTNIEITDSNIKSFDRVARKYGIDYALKKDTSVSPPKYLVFFKGKDTDALTAAFSEYSAKRIRNAERPSIIAVLAKFKALVKANTLDRVKNRDKELTR